MSNCVRCGDPKQMHCKADGSNVRNAACGGFLTRWPDEIHEEEPVIEVQEPEESER